MRTRRHEGLETSWLFDHNHRSQLAKLSIAYTTHHHQVFRAAKRPVLLAMRDYSFSNAPAHARQFFKFRRRGGIDIY